MNDSDLLVRMHDEMREMKASMNQMAEAITRLAVLEEKHQGMAGTVAKVIDQVAQLQERQHQAEVHRELVVKFMDQVDKLTTAVSDLKLQFAETMGKAKGVGFAGRILWGIGGGTLGVIAMRLLQVAFSN